MLVKCPSCKGAKKVMGLGSIYKTCLQCKGAGEIRSGSIKFETKISTLEDKPLDKPIQDIKEPETVEFTPAVNDEVQSEKSKPKNHKGSSSHGKDKKAK